MLIRDPKQPDTFILTSEKYDIRIEANPFENKSKMVMIEVSVMIGDLAFPAETTNTFPNQALPIARHLLTKYEQFVKYATTNMNQGD